jgi:hypothetical protein
MPLTQRQIEYGFIHYFKEDWKKIDTVTTVAEFRGQAQLTINCTQLSAGPKKEFASAASKQRVLAEWCDFLRGNPKQFTLLAFGTRMPQELLDAVCQQVNLQRLEIKWGVYQNLSPIANLQKLALLQIGSGAGVKSIAPLTELPRLIGLAIENFQQISDYSPLARLKKLQSLTIEGDAFGPRSIRIQSLKFLVEMTQLRHLTLLTYRLQDKNYRHLERLRKLEHLTLPYSREVKACYENLIQLPKLKWGLLKTNPELYLN